ncbi:MAG: hypothetical protein MPW14_01455 [Candidatus Manganitrophus sp.]|nr:MAG: hypothetical protein MPW14_01455 [Candidatus Manganitrophus sp.]
MVFYPVAVQNRLVFEMQRVILKYSFSDLVNLQIGRMHTALGYWNHTFHHGTWLQTTVLRPEIYRFDEYDHGLLPVHSVGVEFFGTKAFRPLHLEYHLGVTNGRGKTTNTADAIQNLRDDNDSKAFNFLLGLTPRLIEGLQVGEAFISTKYRPIRPNRRE